MRSRRRPAAFVVLVSVVALMVAPSMVGRQDARAAEALDLRGHGWGHGRGLGQYGALGYALNHSWTAAQILGHFYSNTQPGTIDANSPITVRMTGRDGQSTIVTQERGHMFTSADGGGTAHTAIRIDRVGPGTFQVFFGNGCGGPWTPKAGQNNAGSIDVWPQLVNDDRQEMLQICESNGTRWVRGRVRAVDADNSIRTVNEAPLDGYLRGVVPREMPASWADLGGGKGAQALRSQAVAARSYAWAENRAPWAKTCDTISCQVYGGRAEQINGVFRDLEDGRSNAAIAATAGQIRLLNGGVARTEFSSSTGGWTAGGTFPAVPDEGDAVSLNPNHTWTTSISAAALENHYKKGAFQGAEILQKNGLGEDGGRVITMRLRFSGGTVDTTGNGFRAAFGLKSDWFTITGGGVPGRLWEWLGGTLVSAPAVASWDVGRLDVFVQGTDNALWHKWHDSQWRGWEWLGGDLTSAPSATSRGPGRLDVFARGRGNQLIHKSHDNGWTGWSNLDGQLVSAPAVAAWGPGRLDVFVQGTDNALWHKWFSGGQWSHWESLGGVLTSAPTVAAWASGRLDIFVRGTDGAAWHIWYDGSWQRWESMGGAIRGAPSVTTWGAGRLDVFARGTDDGLHQKTYGTNGWGAWIPHGGGLTSSPAAEAWGPGRLDVFVRGTDNGMWHTWWG